MFGELLPIFGSLASGYLVKRYSKARGSDIHRLGSPVVAVVAAGAIAAVTGDSAAIQDVAQAGVEYGAAAVAAHSVVKNGLQLLRDKLGI